MRHSGTEGSHIGHTGPLLHRRRILVLLLGLTFVHGLLYLAIFPPWQHYDEPTHFEYVRLIAERNRLPKVGDYDLTMRREIAASMQAAGFYKELGTPPNQFLSDEPPNIGISELRHPPLYYILLALPQKLVTYQDVETQLYVARLTSILLYLVVVVAAYGMLGEVFPERPWVPAGVAFFIAMLPPVTDLMSAVNNDVGATAAVSMLLWAGVRLVRHGPSLRRVAAGLLLAGACAATKSTSAFVALAILLALGAGYIPRANRSWVWRGLALAIPLALVAVLTWGGHAAHWVSDNQASAPNRVQVEAPLGRSAFALATEGSRHPSVLFQELGRFKSQSLRGHTVTVGAWVKAPAGAEGTFRLRLEDGAGGNWQQGAATTDWTFQAFTDTVEVDAPGIAVYVSLPSSAGAAQELYIDGLVLVDGEMPLSEPPRFETDQARTLQWGAGQVTNLLENGSAEKIWPGLRTWIGSKRIYRTPIALIFSSLWDLSRTGWIYRPELSMLVQSFWGRFAWNHLALAVPYFYLLGFVTVLSMVGGSIWLVRHLRSHRTQAAWRWHAWGMMAAAFVVAWSATLLRIHPFFLTQHIFWPVARYAVVAIVPTSTLLCLGLAEIVPRRWGREAAWLGVLALIALDAIALTTVILPYYYG